MREVACAGMAAVRTHAAATTASASLYVLVILCSPMKSDPIPEANAVPAPPIRLIR